MSREKRDAIFRIQKNFLRDIGVPEQKKFVPDTFQLDAIESLNRGQDTLVIAPTGSGKTFIATEAIKNVLKNKGRSVYTAPLKALSNSKFSEFKKMFEPAHRVGLLTGDRKIEGDADVVIATTEIYRNELYALSGNYSLVVLDELHYLADPQRGPVWEESIILSPKNSTLLMLSASISNEAEIAEWIEQVRGRKVTIIKVTERPVELRLGFMHPEYGVLPIADASGKVSREVAHFYDGFEFGFKRRGKFSGKANRDRGYKKRGR